MSLKSVVCWFLQILLAIVLGVAAVAKFSADPMTVQTFQNLGMGNPGRHLIASIELLAALLLLIPASAAWGAILTWGLMTGALIAHFTQLGVAGDMGPLTFLALCIWLGSCALLYLQRQQVPLIRSMFERAEKSNRTDEPVDTARE